MPQTNHQWGELVSIALEDKLMLRLENEASHPEWDDFLSRTCGGDLTQTSWWGRIKESSGFEVYRLVGRVDGEIIGGAQILARPLGPLGKAAYVPYGPIAVPSAPDDVIDRLAWQVRETCRGDRIRCAFVQTPEGGERVSAALRRHGFAPSDAGVAPRASLRIDVTKDPDELLAQMVPHARAHVRRGMRDPLTVRSGTREDLARFHELHCCTAARHGFQPVQLEYLELLWDELRPSGLVELLLVHTDGTYLAGLLVTRFGDASMERISGYAPDLVPRKKMRPNDALRWTAILGAREQGDRWYDLGGVELTVAQALAEGVDPTADAMLASRSAHKLGLGGTPLVYPEPLGFFPNRMLSVGYRVLGGSRPARQLRGSLQARWRFGSTATRSDTGGVLHLGSSALAANVEDAADHPEWDDFVARTHGGDLVQSSAWGRIKHAAGMDVHRVVVRVDGGIVGGAQLLARPLAPLGRVAYVPYGPLLVPDAPDDAARLMHQELRQLCRRRAIRALVVQPAEDGEHIATALRAMGFRPTGVDVAASASLRVDLRLSPDELLLRMSKHTRRDFKQSLRGPASVRFATRGTWGPSMSCTARRPCGTASRRGRSAISNPYGTCSLRRIRSRWCSQTSTAPTSPGTW